MTKAQPGDVLVVDAKGYLSAAAWGDVLTYVARVRKIAGLVIDGAVRDVAATIEMGFPVYCRGVTIAGPTKSQPGKVNVPVIVGGCLVQPGDIVVGDGDGIVIVPAAEVAAAIKSGEAREQREIEMRNRLDGGTTTVEMFALEESLRKWGLT